MLLLKSEKSFLKFLRLFLKFLRLLFRFLKLFKPRVVLQQPFHILQVQLVLPDNLKQLRLQGFLSTSPNKFANKVQELALVRINLPTAALGVGDVEVDAAKGGLVLLLGQADLA